MEDSCGTTIFTGNPRLRETCGETLPNGDVIDLVAAVDRDALDVLSWNGKEAPSIAAAVDGGNGVFYQPPDLHPSVRQAITFPRGPVEYGTITELFTQISGLFSDMSLPEDLAAFATCWILASWVPELLPIPLVLCVSGAPAYQINKLFKIFRALARRSLLVAELKRGLPFFLRPTLMVDDPNLTAKTRAFWRSAICSGMFVSGTGNTVRQLTCSLAVLLRPEDPTDAWGEDAMHLVLPQAELPSLSNQVLASIAAKFQPRLQMFRVRQMSRPDQFVSPTHPLSRFQLSRNLGACIPEDAAIVQILTPLFESHEQDSVAPRSRDPKIALMEAVWVPSHDQDDMSAGEITKRVNAILRSRGVSQEYNVREIGWKLRNLCLGTTSNGKCKVLQFTGSTRYGIHRCVRDFGLQLPLRKDCDDCQGLLSSKRKPVE